MSKIITLIMVLAGLISCETNVPVDDDTKVDKLPETEIVEDLKEEKPMKTVKDNFGKVYFLGDTDKNPLEYEVGEEMRFTVTLYGDGEVISAPYFDYEVTSDDGSRNSGKLEAVSGSADIIASCSVPGYVRVRVFPCDENGSRISAQNISPFEGGACAGFDDIEQTVAEPSDFDEFWEEQKAELFKVEPKLLESVSVSGGGAGFDVYDIKIQCVDGSRPVSGYVSVPANAQPGSCKLRLVYQAYGVASSVITCKDGYISLYMNPHGIENGKTANYYSALNSGELASFGFKGNDPPENSYFRNMLLRDIQAIRYITSAYSDLWNGKDLVLEGGSLGAFRATAAATLMNDTVSELVINIPGMCNHGSTKDGRLPGWGPGYCEGIRYYDTVNFARRVKAKVTITAGLGDYTCPPSGITVLYRAFTTDKTITFIQNKTHSYNPEKIISYTK